MQSSYHDQASQMSDRVIDEEGLVGCFASFSLGVSDNKADGIKNGCLSDSNESPHFSRPNSIERRTL